MMVMLKRVGARRCVSFNDRIGGSAIFSAARLRFRPRHEKC